jgi:hypothetical protein
MQMYCKQWAAMYNQYGPPKPVEFIQVRGSIPRIFELLFVHCSRVRRCAYLAVETAADTVYCSAAGSAHHSQDVFGRREALCGGGVY